MKVIEAGLGGFKIIQHPSSIDSIGMSYFIITPAGTLVVIDGGQRADGLYLRDKIKEYGGTVHSWFLSHGHNDHIGALPVVLDNIEDIKIERLYSDLPPLEWLGTVEGSDQSGASELLSALSNCYETEQIQVKRGMIISVDGMDIEVLSDASDYKNTDNINDTTVVLRFCFPNKKTAVFLGDMNVKSGEILADTYGEDLKSDIVQMAHHGQSGVSFRVYKLINPDICLWPTPSWLWDNNSGKGYDSGPWKTLQVRAWMDELNVKTHGIMTEGEITLI